MERRNPERPDRRFERLERRPRAVLTAMRARTGRRFRRGAYILPSMLTLGNLFCGYACVVYAARGEFTTAAPFIGFAIVLDMLDGRIARMTGTSSAFGLEFDSLADVISFGMAPALLAFFWGMQPLGRLGWAAGFLFVSGAALRLARFNISTASTDKRYFVGMPSPAAASVPASTVFALAQPEFFPEGIQNYQQAVPVLAVVLIPAFLMVSRFRFRAFKTFDLSTPKNYRVILLGALVLFAVATNPHLSLVLLSYAYLASAFIGLAWSRLRRRGGEAPPAARDEAPPSEGDTATRSAGL